MWLQPSREPLEIKTLSFSFFSSWYMPVTTSVINGSHNGCMKERIQLPSVCQRLSHYMKYIAPWYKPLFIGMFLCLASSFLTLQI